MKEEGPEGKGKDMTLPVRIRITFRPSSSLPGSGTACLNETRVFERGGRGGGSVCSGWERGGVGLLSSNGAQCNHKLTRDPHPRSKSSCSSGLVGSRPVNQSGAPLPSTDRMVQKWSITSCARNWLNLAERRKRRRKASSAKRRMIP